MTNSIVDYLKSQKQDSSFEARTKLAGDFGVENYSGSAEQNISLLGKLKNVPAPTSAPSSTPAPEVKKIEPKKVIQPKKVESFKPTTKIETDLQKSQRESGVTPQKQAEFDRQQAEADKKYVAPVTHEDWRQRGKKPTELVELVEKKYGINAEYNPKSKQVVGYDAEGNKVKSWHFDSAGESIRTDHKVYTDDQFLSDYQNILASGDKKQVSAFLKKNLSTALNNKDEVRSQYETFLKQVNINEKASKLSSLDGRGLWEANNRNEFAVGDDVWNALSPEQQEKYNAFKKLNIKQLVNKKNKDGTHVEVVADINSVDDAEEIFNHLQAHNPTLQAKYNEIIINNTKRSTLQGTLTEKYSSLTDKRREYDRVKEAMEKKYPQGSPTYIRAKINQERGTLMTEIEDLVDDYEVTLSEYNIVNADVQAEYGVYTKDAEIEMQTYQTSVNLLLKNQGEVKIDTEKLETKELLEQNQKFALLNTEEAFNKYQTFEAKRIAGKIKGEYVTNSGGLFYEEESGKIHQIISGKEFSTSLTGDGKTIKEYQNDDGTITASVFNSKTGNYDVVTKDIYGNVIYPGLSNGEGIDMRSYRSKFPNDAWSGTNNPSGLTFDGMSAGLKKALSDAGITYSKGINRPEDEGGSYVQFDSIQDGLDATWIAFARNGDNSVNARLQSWVGTKEGPAYAKQVMKEAGIEGNPKIKDLTSKQSYELRKAIMQKESYNLYGIFQKNGWLGENSFTIPQGNGTKDGYNPTGDQYKTAMDGYNAFLNAPAPKKMTEAKGKYMLFANSMMPGSIEMTELENEFFLKQDTVGKYYDTFAPNLLKSEERQKLENTGRTWTEAYLRALTGAAATQGEVDRQWITYFAQPGDKIGTIKQKQAKRELATKGILLALGKDGNGNRYLDYFVSSMGSNAVSDISVQNQAQVYEQAYRDFKNKGENKDLSSEPVDFNIMQEESIGGLGQIGSDFTGDFSKESLYDFEKGVGYYGGKGTLQTDSLPQNNIDFSQSFDLDLK